MTIKFAAEEFEGFGDHDSGRLFSDIEFRGCSFQSCGCFYDLLPGEAFDDLQCDATELFGSRLLGRASLSTGFTPWKKGTA
jgi:hypothetical protein